MLRRNYITNERKERKKNGKKTPNTVLTYCCVREKNAVGRFYLLIFFWKNSRRINNESNDMNLLTQQNVETHI